MNLVKRMITCATFALAAFSFSTADAQGGGMRGDTAAQRQMMEARLAKIKTDLNLTDVQSDSVKTIWAEYSGKMRAIFMDPANQGMSREDRMAKIQPLRDEENTRLQNALGSDLYKKYQDWMQANRPQRGGGGGGR